MFVGAKIRQKKQLKKRFPFARLANGKHFYLSTYVPLFYELEHLPASDSDIVFSNFLLIPQNSDTTL